MATRARTARGFQWSSVALGWLVAFIAGIVISPILRLIYVLIADFTFERGQFTLTILIISLVSGFVAYLIGGYVASRGAQHSGGAHGAMTAVFGLVIGIILAIILAILRLTFYEAVAVPPATFGLVGGAGLGGFLLFVINVLGGFIGGKLGGPSRS